MAHFIPVALDTYFRGAGDEVEFCGKIKAGGNHMAVASAGGKILGHGDALRMREKELSKALEEFTALPEEERKPKIEVPADVAPPKRHLPAPPANGLILKGYCTYMKADEKGKIDRSQEWYYRENPDRWPAETQNDMLWLTESEWKSLVPTDPKKGDRADVAGHRSGSSAPSPSTTWKAASTPSSRARRRCPSRSRTSRPNRSR